ncbi:MAG: hexokinase family protein [Planctomycetota bacterium]|jgi:hexokinase
MSDVKQKAVDFLLKYEMDVENIDFEKNLSDFLEQMELGLAGGDSSLEMISTFVETGNAIPVNERVIVADAGGTNFRVATVYFNEQKQPVIENLQKYAMPAIDQELSSDQFFEAMAGYFCDVIDASDKVGFCFSYPVEMLPNKDGRVIRFAKEIKAPEVVGQLVNENLNAAFARLGLSSGKNIVLMNDTVATLLAGMDYQNRDFSSYVGFILGTGTNCCYVESNANISKIDGLDPAHSQIINTESGGMGKAHQGRIDAAFDASTNNPGAQKLEKMISGAYLGPLFLQTVRQAAEDGLLPGGAVDGLDELETKDLNDFMAYPHGDNPLAAICKGRQEDTGLVYVLADRLVERASKLTAINLSAMAVKSGCGTDPTRPICIIADGTTYYHMKTLKSRVEFYLKHYLENQRGIYTDIVHVESAPVVGAAIAGLTN